MLSRTWKKHLSKDCCSIPDGKVRQPCSPYHSSFLGREMMTFVPRWSPWVILLMKANAKLRQPRLWVKVGSDEAVKVFFVYRVWVLIDAVASLQDDSRCWCILQQVQSTIFWTIAPARRLRPHLQQHRWQLQKLEQRERLQQVRLQGWS